MNILQKKTEAFITPMLPEDTIYVPQANDAGYDNNDFTVTPTKPKVLSEDRIYVYVPQATSTNAGIASYDSNDFIITKSHITINREMRDAHIRPEVVLLDSEYFPKEIIVGTGGRYYYKYKTSAIHYIQQNLTEEQKQIARENIDAVSNLELATTLLNYYTKDETYNKTEIDNTLLDYYTKDETYNKTEIDNTLLDYAKDNIYNKIEVDNKLLNYYTKDETYTKAETYDKIEVDNKLLNYYTKDETYNKTEINELISVIPKFDIEVVTELPTTNISVNTIYLLVKDDTEPDLYDEYIYINNKWELLGSQQIDFTVTADMVFSVIQNSETVVSKVENDKLIFEVNGKLVNSENVSTLIQNSETVVSKVENDKLIFEVNGKLVNSENIYTIIEDSDTIVSMINNDKIKFELATDLISRLNKTLITPVSAPDTIELVAVDNGNSQTMIGIGDGLIYENGMLKAIPQGGEETVVVLDTLTSQSTTDALSAKQGNVLYQMAIAAGEKINEVELNSQKHILIGADGILEENVYNFTVDNSVDYEDYKTHLSKFLIDLNLPIVGDLDTTKEVAITFGNTVYYVHNILKGMEHATIGDLHQVDKYSNETGYRFICEMTFFDTGDIVGFAIIPTISMSDILSLDSDQMDNYMADGGLSQGQLAVCRKVTNNGYTEGALYRFDITYPDTYSWTLLKGEIDTELNINSENSVQNKVITAALNNRYTKSEVDGLITGLGTVFDLKGTKATVQDLPSTGNEIGDVWYVVSEQVGYIWLNDGTQDKWEQFGSPIDLSGYVQYVDIINNVTSTATNKALSAYQGKVLNDLITAIRTDLTTAQGNITSLSNNKANATDLANYIPQGGTLTAPLKVTGGDQGTAGKIALDQNNRGQITNTGTQTLFGFLDTTQLAVGHTSYYIRLRGNEARPKYNNNDMALLGDIPTFSLDGTTLTITI